MPPPTFEDCRPNRRHAGVPVGAGPVTAAPQRRAGHSLAAQTQVRYRLLLARIVPSPSQMAVEYKPVRARGNPGSPWQKGTGSGPKGTGTTGNGVPPGACPLWPPTEHDCPGIQAARERETMGGRLLGLYISAVASLAMPASANATPRPLASLIPADCLVAYLAKPYAASGSAAQATTTRPAAEERLPELSIASIIVFLNASGLIPDEGQVFADVAAALPLLGEFEHAVVLLDVSSRAVRTSSGPGNGEEVSLRLKDLQAAILFRTKGRQRLILEHINRIAGRYTNEQVGDLEVVDSAATAHQRLKDERLPGWAIWEWGRIDDFFVISFGSGAFEKIVSTSAGKQPSLSSDPWFRSAQAATNGAQAAAQCYIALSRVEDRLAQVAQRRHTRVIRALEAERITRDLWTIGQEGQALTWYRCYQRDGQDVLRRYSDPSRYPAKHRRIVPPKARRYGIIHVPTRWLVDNLPRAWLAAQAESEARSWSKVWSNLEQEAGIDIHRGIIEHLGENVVI